MFVVVVGLVLVRVRGDRSVVVLVRLLVLVLMVVIAVTVLVAMKYTVRVRMGVLVFVGHERCFEKPAIRPCADSRPSHVASEASNRATIRARVGSRRNAFVACAASL